MLHALRVRLLLYDDVTCTETPFLWWCYVHGDSLSVVLHTRKRLVCDDVTCTETPFLWLCNTYTLKLLLCRPDMAYVVDKVLRTSYLLAYSSSRVWLMRSHKHARIIFCLLVRDSVTSTETIRWWRLRWCYKHGMVNLCLWWCYNHFFTSCETHGDFSFSCAFFGVTRIWWYTHGRPALCLRWCYTEMML